MNRKKRGWLTFAAACTAVAVTAAALDVRLAARRYELKTEKVTAPVRLVLLSDLHGCDYGPGAETLTAAVAAESPDAVLMAGDMVDDDMPMEPSYEAIAALSARWSVYYVSGNHEYRTGRLEEIKKKVASCGAVVLDGASITLSLNGQYITLGGVCDPEAGEVRWREELSASSAGVREEIYSILLTHRPERVAAYQESPFDLAAAGHAHGGQWRLPGLINGLLAPNQGFFPDYAGGRYGFPGMTLLVSRGLARESTRIPRVFNRPEVVSITLSPAGEPAEER